MSPRRRARLFALACGVVVVLAAACDDLVALGGPDDASTSEAAKDAGDCTGVGRCSLFGFAACPGVVMPVCDCTGTTRPNDCMATQSGNNIAHDGACP